MGIRELQRRATPELLEGYLAQLPRIKDPRQFRTVLHRARATAAILEISIADQLLAIETPQ